MRAHRFEHRGKGKFFAVFSSREHGPARNEDRRNVHPYGAHQHAGDNFIAVSHKNATVECVRVCKDFRRIGDDLARGQGIFHALVSHCDPVAHADRRHDNGLAARGDYALGNRPRDFV